MNKNNKIVIGVVAIVILIAAGTWYSGNKQPKVISNEPIKIGYIGPFSGPSAVLGMDAIKAIEIAADEANAKAVLPAERLKLLLKMTSI
jgi:branched-chain amino acid transport system substrate-binding protein